MVIAGLVVDHADVPGITADSLRLKQVYFPGSLKGATHLLDYVLSEIKSTDVRQELRSASRNDNRHAISYLDKILALFEQYDAKIIGRVWVKQPATSLDQISTYTYAIQDLARHFDHMLQSQNDVGLVVCDSRMHPQNRQVSHNIFTRKHRRAGDALPRLVESPVFGVSDNHVGLQLADLLAGTFLFPMACRVYCQGCTAPSHMNPKYDKVRERYAVRLRRLQHLYKDAAGRSRGGIVVSDARGRRPSRDLFAVPAATPAAVPATASIS
jgi:hypothetical protein